MPAQRQQVLSLVNKACCEGARKSLACDLVGLSVRTLQRWKKAGRLQDGRLEARQAPGNKLCEIERKRIIQVANKPCYAHLSPHQIVPLLADEGCYLASEATFYRVLKAEGQMAHREKNRPSKAREKPMPLVATQPNEIYSWDITYLPTIIRGLFFYLYLMLDVYSRKIVGWQVHDVESSEYAAHLLTDVCKRGCIAQDQVTLHSDNGSPMKGATMLATIQQLGVISSFSRPSVSNDNPYSESLFKTLKYRPEYPQKPFTDLDEARTWVEGFVDWYNHEHLHSGIKFVTPEQRHKGEDIDLLAKRHQVYQTAKAKNPRRWSGDTRNWEIIEEVLLNPGKVNKQEVTTQRAA